MKIEIIYYPTNESDENVVKNTEMEDVHTIEFTTRSGKLIRFKRVEDETR